MPNYAEDLPYWKSGQSSPDTWVERTVKVLQSLGGTILMEAFGKDASGRAAFVLACKIGDDNYRVVWPVLPSKAGNEKAARIQAATMMYHDIKAKAVSAAVLGVRSSFFSYLQLLDGRTPVEMSKVEIANTLHLFALSSGEDIIDGEVTNA